MDDQTDIGSRRSVAGAAPSVRPRPRARPAELAGIAGKLRERRHG